jgi:hypothetical protein
MATFPAMITTLTTVIGCYGYEDTPGFLSAEISYLVLTEVRPASWLGGQNFLVLTMRSRVRFPVLPWEFYLAGEDPHSDHGLGSL